MEEVAFIVLTEISKSMRYMFIHVKYNLIAVPWFGLLFIGKRTAVGSRSKSYARLGIKTSYATAVILPSIVC